MTDQRNADHHRASALEAFSTAALCEFIARRSAAESASARVELAAMRSERDQALAQAAALVGKLAETNQQLQHHVALSARLGDTNRELEKQNGTFDFSFESPSRANYHLAHFRCTCILLLSQPNPKI